MIEIEIVNEIGPSLPKETPIKKSQPKRIEKTPILPVFSVVELLVNPGRLA